jgi:hypothetical protein
MEALTYNFSESARVVKALEYINFKLLVTAAVVITTLFPIKIYYIGRKRLDGDGIFPPYFLTKQLIRFLC